MIIGRCLTGWAVGAMAAWLLASVALPSVSLADEAPGVAVRTGNHTGYGRVVFDVAPGVRYQLSRDGDTLTIRFPDTTTLLPPSTPPNNVRGLRATGARADLVLSPGAAVREMRVDGRVVIDVLDPGGGPPPVVKAAKPAPAPPKVATTPPKPPPTAIAAPPSIPPPERPPPGHPVALTAEPPAPRAADTPRTEPPAPPAAAPIVETRAVTPSPARAGVSASDGVTAFTVPFGPQAGAALFRRGASTYVVFDERRPIDLSALRDNPAFNGATMRELQSGTLIALSPPANMVASLLQSTAGWKIAVQPSPKPGRAIALVPADGRLNLPVDSPGSVVSMADPATGATLLVGTLRVPGQAVAMLRRTPEFVLLPTGQGVVVEPLADAVGLRTVPTGFQINGGPAGLAMTAPSPATEAALAAVHLTRRFRLPGQTPEALVARLSKSVSDTASAPPRARGPKRRAAASIMLSLGLASEAQALLRVAAEQDPKEAASPETIGLTAIAALLAGRVADAGGLSDPRLSGTDEIALWRGVALALRDEASPEAAAIFAATAPLALLYPPGIRDKVLPIIAETLLLGGEPMAAKRLLAMAPGFPGLGFARALMKQADGDTPGALVALDAMAGAHDQRDRARAATRAVELRLAGGQLNAEQAADALDKLRLSWRGDRRELALRERLADLRQRSGSWRKALAELRSAEADFPDRAASIHTHLLGSFTTLLDSEATAVLTPLDLVALIDENADLFKGLLENEELLGRMADRLIALDLPGRAEPLLDKLVHMATIGAARGMFGARLAELRLREGDTPGVLKALADSAGVATEPRVIEQRAMLAANAKSRLGDPAGAIAELASLAGPNADTARAAVHEQAGDWPAAKGALAAVVASVIPDGGDLTDAHRQLLLRLATAAERAGDRDALTEVRTKFGPRLGPGPLSDMLRLLTAEPLKAVQDLPRTEREIGLARAVPAGLAALRTE